MTTLLLKISTWLATHWRGVSCYLAGVLTVVLLAVWCDKPTPQTTTAIHRVYDTIRAVDTITQQTSVTVVKRYAVHDTVIITIHDTVRAVRIDTLGCLTGKYDAPDSAKIEWSACSEEFPKSLSDRIMWDIKYFPAPKITERITITDTIIPSLFWHDIKTGATWGAIGAGLGIIGGLILGAK